MKTMRPWALAAIAALALVTSGARAENPSERSAKSADTLSDKKVVRDKETGRFRAPTAEEAAELKASARSLAPNVLTVRRPVASVEVRANGSAVGKRTLDQMDHVVLQRTPDGIERTTSLADRPGHQAVDRRGLDDHRGVRERGALSLAGPRNERLGRHDAKSPAL